MTHVYLPIRQRMQTAPKGTYSGMLHCAGGILKNEGPLAFYKVCLNSILSIQMVGNSGFRERCRRSLVLEHASQFSLPHLNTPSASSPR